MEIQNKRRMIYQEKEHLISALKKCCGLPDFVKKPYLTVPINDFFFTDTLQVEEKLKCFDKDGFEISNFEKIYFAANGLHVNNIALGHDTLAIPWIDKNDFKDFPTIHIDHSFISIRPAFNETAWDQLYRYKNVIPILIKPLKLRRKYGLDISLEIIEGEYCSELFHIEYDFSTLSELWLGVCSLQDFITGTNWYEAIESVKQFDRMFANLLSDDESDLKAKLLGYNRTFNTVKAIR